MESLRQNGRINISAGIDNQMIKKDEVESHGARSKFWFNDWNYLYKETFQESYEDYAELIASELAKTLGIACAEYDLAEYCGRRGIITKNFVDEEKGEELISGYEIINEVYLKYILPLKFVCESYYEKIARCQERTNKELLPAQKREIMERIYIECQNSNLEFKFMKSLDLNKLKSLNDEQVATIFNKFSEVFENAKGLYNSGLFKASFSLCIEPAVTLSNSSSNNSLSILFISFGRYLSYF